MNGITSVIDQRRFGGEFRTADADGSGKLGREEVMKYMKAKDMSVDESYLDELLGVFDTDGSGDIDEKEFTGLVRLMLSHERAIAAAEAKADGGSGSWDDEDEAECGGLTCFGQACSRFCALMVCGIFTVVFLALLWPVSVTSCKDGMSNAEANDLSGPNGGTDRRRAQAMTQGPVNPGTPPPTPPVLNPAVFVPMDASCSDPAPVPFLPHSESYCQVGASAQSEFHCLNGGSCVDVPPSVCSASGDPHYTSFDGKRFDFMGTGDFWLVNSDRIKLQGRHTPCNGNRPTCFIAFAAAICDGSVAPQAGQDPCSTAAEWVVAHRQEGSLDIQFPADCKAAGEATCKIHITSSGSSFRIKLPGMYYKQTDGLCGNFDTDPADDGGFCTSRTACNENNADNNEFRVLEEESLFTGRPTVANVRAMDTDPACSVMTGTDVAANVAGCFSMNPPAPAGVTDTCAPANTAGLPAGTSYCAPWAAGWTGMIAELPANRGALAAMLHAEENFLLEEVLAPHTPTKDYLQCTCDASVVCGFNKCQNLVNVENADYDPKCMVAVRLCEHGLTDIAGCVDDMCEGLRVAAEGVIEAAHEIAIEMGNEPDPIHYYADRPDQGGWNAGVGLGVDRATRPLVDWAAQVDPCDPPANEANEELSFNPCTRAKHGTCAPAFPSPDAANPGAALHIAPEYECLCDPHWHTDETDVTFTRFCDIPGEHADFFHIHETHNFACDCPVSTQAPPHYSLASRDVSERCL